MVEETSNRRVAAEVAPSGDPERSCKVCGDRANGYNFGVLTCESCKAFFRRNAAREEDIKCPFSSSCQMTSASRRFCQACRLHKCFAVGMNRDWLLDQKPKIKRRKLKKESNAIAKEEGRISDYEQTNAKSNYNKKEKPNNIECTTPQCCSCICHCGYYPEGTRLSDISPATPQSSYLSPSSHSSIANHSLIDASPLPLPLPITAASRPSDAPSCDFSLLSASAHHDLVCLSSSLIAPFIPSPSASYPVPASTYYSPLSMRPSPQTATEASNANSPAPLPMLPEQFAMKPFHDNETFIQYLESLTTPDIQQELDKYKNLNPDERISLWELLVYDKPLREPLELPSNVSPDVLNDKVVYGALSTIVNFALAKVLKVINCIRDFQDLNIDDRLTLIKLCYGALLTIRGAMVYDFSNGTWNHSFLMVMGEVRRMTLSINLLAEAGAGDHFRKEQESFLNTFEARVRKSPSAMMCYLMTAIFRGEKVLHSKNANKIFDLRMKYLNMLKKILKEDFGEMEGLHLYTAMLEISFDRTQHSINTAISDMERSIVEPLLNELIKANKVEQPPTSSSI